MFDVYTLGDSLFITCLFFMLTLVSFYYSDSFKEYITKDFVFNIFFTVIVYLGYKIALLIFI